MNYFPATIGSEKVTIDGEKVKDKLELTTQNVKNLILNNDSRCFFYVNQVVVYNDELYVLNQYGLYKSKNGAKWGKILEIADLPSRNGWRAVVFNDEIHFLNRQYHYKWDGNTLTSVSTPPDSGGSAVVFNDEIHILGGSGTPTKHYKWDGTTWTSVSTLPYNFTGYAVIYNNEIHIMGGFWGGVEYSRHYKWDGSTWTQLTSLPYAGTVLAVVLNDEIHIMGGSKGSSGGLGNSRYHYKYGSGSWTRLDDIVFSIVSGSDIYTVGVDRGSAFVYNDGIYVAGDGDTSGAGNEFSYLCRIVNAKMYRQ